MIKVKVKAGAKNLPAQAGERILQKSENSFEISVKEKVERGEANRAVRRVLADYFKIPLSKIRLIKGARQPNKIFEILLTF